MLMINCLHDFRHIKFNESFISVKQSEYIQGNGHATKLIMCTQNTKASSELHLKGIK